MLSVLHIENIAVIEQADITFDAGFNVLTGETGAGKSIVIDAISAILGERAYRDVIRTGCDKAFVSAVFTGIGPLDWFTENQVEYQPEELLIQREIWLDGKNVCRVNGRPVTVALLRKLGIQLINIHGQHDSQQLFDEANHLRYLDLFAKDEAELAAYTAAFETVQQTRAEIRRLSMDESEKLRRVETLRYQIEEIEGAKLKPGEDEQLEALRKRLQNSEKMKSGLCAAVNALYGGEDSDGACSLLTDAERSLGSLCRFDESLEPLQTRLTDAAYLIRDITEELRDLRDSLSFSEGELEQLEERLDVIHKLRRKYGATCVDILEFLEKCRRELDEIEFSSDRLEQLQKDLEKQEAKAKKAGLALRKIRKTAADALAERILSELVQLDMPKVQFVCQFEELELTATGMDEVRFLMSANVGEDLKPMSKVASGGELARIMLALKNVLAEQDHVPTLIFDEVDAGVSGQAAQKVAEKLCQVARTKQILCVTHLAQLAAMAHTHLYISKAVRKGRTYTSVTPLDMEGRKQEIARIIGGAVITDTTLKSAEEMLRH
ncbi:MAG TPA: DNA repair protein RecN [Candidatus Avoscillospira avistercoris]|uniref:DNA repair protein RecN n=1 Tax=Candidatus Avoscillospira avistercoris TaxID=2840707 RepID=A0A9D1FAA0_9FIRM|nr:DNA repair protein RecN [Candidatus Avoscillospira avistercoris]